MAARLNRNHSHSVTWRSIGLTRHYSRPRVSIVRAEQALQLPTEIISALGQFKV